MTDHRRACPSEWHQAQCSRGIEGVARLPGAGEPQHQRPRPLSQSIGPQPQLWHQEGANDLMTIKAATTIAPATPEIPVLRLGPAVAPLQQDGIPPSTHGVSTAKQSSRRRADASEQIDHHQGVITPVPAKTDKTPQRRVITTAISTRGVQPHKQKRPFTGPPAPGQRPAVLSVLTEAGFRPRDEPDRAAGCADWPVHLQRD